MSEDNTESTAAENPVVEEVTATAEAATDSKPEQTPEVEKPTKGSECAHPSNTTGYHQKGNDGTCIYCGH